MENMPQNYGQPQPLPRSFELDVNTIENLEDVKAIFSGLGLRLYENTPQYQQLKKYFVIDVDAPAEQPQLESAEETSDDNS